jgi:hypothetical protein
MRPVPSILKTLFAATFVLSIAILPMSAVARPTSAEADVEEGWVADPEPSIYVLRYVDGRTVCTDASEDELRALLDRDSTDLHVISPPNHKGANGLTIMLRGTSQLEANQTAKQAFVDAAAVWEARIASPITVVIDVDFGTTFFGQNYNSPQIIGATAGQQVTKVAGYGEVRDKLIENASNKAESDAFNALPTGTIPTDIGGTANVREPSPVLRALGLLPAVADPAGENNSLGGPPAIGFNSAFPFDFNPNDGVDRNEMDFRSVATHEIGHALGFVSDVGNKELNPSSLIRPTIWDFFRLRPGSSIAAFPTASRVLSSGGTHVMFTNAGSELGLSTGRPNHTGGDGQQASHWKAQRFTGVYVGVMNPEVDFGRTLPITNNDILALDFFGYAIAGGSSPVLSTAVADLDLDTLTVTGTGTDADANVIFAEATYLDSAGNTISTLAPVRIDTQFANAFDFTATFAGLRDLPSATKISITLIDGNCNSSSTLTADFSGAETGGPGVTSATFNANKGKLKIKGTNLKGTLQLEVNGQIVAPPAAMKPNGPGTALKVTGSPTALNLRSGPNRIRVIKDTNHSNIYILNR